MDTNEVGNFSGRRYALNCSFGSGAIATPKTLQNFLAVVLLLGFLVAILFTRSVFAENKSVATFAGGCFWCVEHVFDDIPGVLSTTSGYTGGAVANPTYLLVASGSTGHAEAVQVVFDVDRVSYAELLRQFWINIDPTTPRAQFCDRGDPYRPEIFVHSQAQRLAAETTRHNLEQSKPFKEPIGVAITDAKTFYPAEASHQDYHHKNPIRYRFYRLNCERDARLKALWGGYDSHQLTKGMGK